jgi:hypothetical protein
MTTKSCTFLAKPLRKRPLAGQTSRRKKSNTYSLPLNDQNIRVCKVFYLTTLDINHKRVQAYHQKKNQMCGTPVCLQWGKSANRVVPNEVEDGIRSHIK